MPEEDLDEVVTPAIDPTQKFIDQVELKRKIYFYHSYYRSMKRYNLSLSKKRQEDILNAIKKPNHYLPAKLLKDWGERQLYKINYMGTKMKLIYDTKYDCIVTFLPPDSWQGLE